MTKILYGQAEQYHVFKMTGDIRYGDIIALQQYLESFDIAEKTVVVDLSEAAHLDSTALGVLAILASKSREAGDQKPTIYVTNPVVVEALMGVCFDLIFTIKQQVFEHQAIDFNEMGNGTDDINIVGATVTSAHQALSDISETNKQLFKDVNQLLKKL